VYHTLANVYLCGKRLFIYVVHFVYDTVSIPVTTGIETVSYTKCTTSAVIRHKTLEISG